MEFDEEEAADEEQVVTSSSSGDDSSKNDVNDVSVDSTHLKDTNETNPAVDELGTKNTEHSEL